MKYLYCVFKIIMNEKLSSVTQMLLVIKSLMYSCIHTFLAHRSWNQNY